MTVQSFYQESFWLVEQDPAKNIGIVPRIVRKAVVEVRSLMFLLAPAGQLMQ